MFHKVRNFLDKLAYQKSTIFSVTMTKRIGASFSVSDVITSVCKQTFLPDLHQCRNNNIFFQY